MIVDLTARVWIDRTCAEVRLAEYHRDPVCRTVGWATCEALPPDTVAVAEVLPDIAVTYDDGSTP